MNKTECSTANWRTIGFEDGAAGKNISQLTAHRKACAEHGITPELDAYRQGREQGLQTYCQEAIGFQRGKSGHNYKGVCPGRLEKDFLVGYEAGKNLYNLNHDIRHSQRAIEKKHEEIKELQKLTDKKESLLVSDVADKKERKKLLHDIKEMQQKIGSLEAQITELEQRSAVLKYEYQELSDRYSYDL